MLSKPWFGSSQSWKDTWTRLAFGLKKKIVLFFEMCKFCTFQLCYYILEIHQSVHTYHTCIIGRLRGSFSQGPQNHMFAVAVRNAHVSPQTSPHQTSSGNIVNPTVHAMEGMEEQLRASRPTLCVSVAVQDRLSVGSTKKAELDFSSHGVQWWSNNHLLFIPHWIYKNDLFKKWNWHV